MSLTSTADSAAESQLEILESKIHRTLELLTQARAENSRLKQELAERDKERQDVRHRVERLLKQVDALTKDDQ